MANPSRIHAFRQDNYSNDISNNELGRAIGISGETIKSHLKSIFQKLGVSGRSEAVARGYDLGMLNIPL